jgi:YjbE family integral membrane protein
MVQWVMIIGGIVLADLVLSGDNALIIGIAASGLPKKQRLWAIIFGGGGAMILRIFFTVLATVFLQIPYLGACGAIIVLGLAVKILLDRSKNAARTLSDIHGEQEALRQRGDKGLLASLATILVADVTMSLDNILAVGALAEGNVVFLVIGLVISLCILLVGSSLIAQLMDHLPWLLDVACLMLAWTASHIFLGDDSLQNVFAQLPWIQYVVPVLALAVVSITDIYLHRHKQKIRPLR